jgi:hypothetical protein
MRPSSPRLSKAFSMYGRRIRVGATVRNLFDHLIDGYRFEDGTWAHT